MPCRDVCPACLVSQPTSRRIFDLRRQRALRFRGCDARKQRHRSPRPTGNPPAGPGFRHIGGGSSTTRKRDRRERNPCLVRREIPDIRVRVATVLDWRCDRHLAGSTIGAGPRPLVARRVKSICRTLDGGCRSLPHLPGRCRPFLECSLLPHSIYHFAVSALGLRTFRIPRCRCRLDAPHADYDGAHDIRRQPVYR
ncbi:hypothetical protein D9M70_539470 [compost metagenome]